MRKAAIIIANLAIFSALSGIVLAQEQPASEEARIDTEIKAEDLGVKEARILPGTFFYGFKDFFRGTRETLTRDPVKKAELQLKHANERVIEAKQLVEKDGSEKSARIAAGVLKGVNKNFANIVRQRENLKKIKARDPGKVDKFLDKVADQSLKQQIILQKLGEQVPEKAFVQIEQARQEHLAKFGEVMTKVAENPKEISQRLQGIVENRQGSDFKELKAIEILRDLEDKVPEDAKDALRMAQTVMSQRFEQRFNQLPEEARTEKLQNYVESMPGNAVRQFEAFDAMRQNFQSPETAEAMEIAKDKAIQKFESRFSEFQGQEARQVFMQPWRNGDPEDLRVMTEMEMRMESGGQNFQQFRQEAQDNFRERFSENPEQLKQNQVFQRMAENPDTVDLKMSQDLVQILKSAPKASEFIKKFEGQATEKFIENVSGLPRSGGGQPRLGGRGTFGPSVPGGLKVLEEIKNKVPLQARQGINRAIEAQTQTIEKHRQPQVPVRPVVPMTQERVQIFEGKQLEQPIQRVEPQPVIEPAPVKEAMPIPESSAAPAPVQ